MSFHDHNIVEPNSESKSRQDTSSRRRLSLKPNLVIGKWRKKNKNSKFTKADSVDLPDEVLKGTTDENQSPRSSEINIKPESTTVASQPLLPLNVSTIENLPNPNDTDKGYCRNVVFRNNEEISIVRDEVKENEQQVERAHQRKSNTASNANKKNLNRQTKPRKLKHSASEKEERPSLKKQRPISLLKTSFQLRDTDFHELFSHISSDEKLIIAYPCAWKKDVYIHGRLYLSPNYISFYACFAKWEESFSIRYQDIVSVTRETPVKFVSKTIRIRTSNGQDYVCACYTSREKIYVSIFRLWQNVLLEQPLNYQQLRAIIDTDHDNHDGSSGDSEESLNLENSDYFSQRPKDNWQSLPANSNNAIESSSQPVILRRSIKSLQQTNRADSYLSTCTCPTHLAKQYANQILNYDVDILFELICGDNPFTRDFHNAQKLFDYNHGEWRINPETGKRERQVSYKTINSSMLGTNTLTCVDRQVIEVNEPHSMYILNTAVYNEGMKYTDAFYVATRFCMIQCDAEHSSLRITAETRYIKNINSFAKSFIEKQVSSSIEQGVNEQVRRLINYRASETGPRASVQLMLPAPASCEQSSETSSSQSQTDDKSSANTSSTPTLSISVTTKTITGKGTLHNIGLIVIIFFLLVHFYLWYKLHSIEDFMLKPEITCWNQCRATCSSKIDINRDL